MMIVIETQYLENYGTEEDPYWKAKGGSCYKVTNVPLNVDYKSVVEAVKGEIEYKSPFSEQYIVGWFIQEDGFLSDFEKSQLEFDGEILFREPEIAYADNLKVTFC